MISYAFHPNKNENRVTWIMQIPNFITSLLTVEDRMSAISVLTTNGGPSFLWLYFRAVRSKRLPKVTMVGGMASKYDIFRNQKTKKIISRKKMTPDRFINRLGNPCSTMDGLTSSDTNWKSDDLELNGVYMNAILLLYEWHP